MLSGGSGSRLWPVSRGTLPKQFIKFREGSTLFGDTVRRIEFDKNTHFTIISNKEHKYLCRREFRKFKEGGTFILEENGRNTAPAILMSALNASMDDILVIMPSDHWIGDDKAFNEIIQMAAEKASTQNCWVTIGTTPREPETGYGYIKATGDGVAKTVLGFTEKPDLKTAKSYLAEGNFFWNSGIFVVAAERCINSFKQYQPKLYDEAYKCWENRDIMGDEITLREEFLNKIPSISVDYAILEKDSNIAMLLFEGEWSDIGSWDSLSKLVEVEKSNNQLPNNVVKIDVQNTFIHSSSRTIAAVGVKDLIIVDHDNATLVVQKGQSEKVKDALEILKSLNEPAASEHTFEYRPWGMFENLLDSEVCKVKRLTVNPGHHLSLQYHLKRSEHWVVVQGRATVQLEGKKLFLESGKSLDIPLGAKHALGNDTDEEVIVIEVQMGSYFGEDDIVRVSDPYNREV
ncbi:mannose-1-phosphate guanylyltransferase/mannose-6-phosphate isomerase [Alphaproteobacteria bacterium]|nr:mannose-1-phosphate guanylyltransferase/mannose-6-phosphate isomerase [Alphaproteobacteria bacterium]